MEEVNVYCDVGSLTLYDSNGYLENQLDTEEKLKSIAEKNYRKLMSKLRQVQQDEVREMGERKLEHQVIDYDRDTEVIELPEAEVVFPRFKPLPTQKILSKWERFAKEKGIKKKKKRSRMVWSEEAQDFVPRWGFNSIKKIKEKGDIVREHKPGMTDPFLESKIDKQMKRKRQKIKEMDNSLRKKGINPGKARRLNLNNHKIKKKKIQKSLNNTQIANASLGKFDHKTNKEIRQKRVRLNTNAPVFKNHS